MAYVHYETDAGARAGIGTRQRQHGHSRSWEYYVAIEGLKTIRVGERVAHVRSGEVLEVPPGMLHSVRARSVPYRGLTLRVPVDLGDKIEL